MKPPLGTDSSGSVRWSPDDKERLLAAGRALEKKGIVSEAVFVSEGIATGDDLKAIRLAAARHGVDAILVVSGIADVDRYNNDLGIAYVFVVTPLFVPGTVSDALFLSHAALWDVRNEYLYASVEADGSASETGSAVFLRDQEVIGIARESSVEELAAGVTEHVAKLGR